MDPESGQLNLVYCKQGSAADCCSTGWLGRTPDLSKGHKSKMLIITELLMFLSVFAPGATVTIQNEDIGDCLTQSFPVDLYSFQLRIEHR